MQKLHCCSSGNGGSKSTGCKNIKRGHGAMSAGEVLEEALCFLPEGCRVALRGHGRGGKRRRGERSLVAAALSKIDAGVALLVREVGVAVPLCFFSGKAAGICVSAVFVSRVLSRSRNRTRQYPECL